MLHLKSCRDQSLSSLQGWKHFLFITGESLRLEKTFRAHQVQPKVKGRKEIQEIGSSINHIMNQITEMGM